MGVLCVESGSSLLEKQKGERNMKIKMLPQEERPVEKAVFHGVSALSNTELIAVLLGSGTRDKSAIGLAEEILATNEGGIACLTGMSVQELMKIGGVGETKAVRLLSGIELGKRISARPKEKRLQIRGTEDVANFFMEELRHEKRENFKAMLLNAKGEVLSVETISIGELTAAPVHPREVFCQAVKKSAASVIFVHNHPSGDSTPSKEDLDTTKRLVECGRLLGIRVVDHVVIGEGNYCSIAGIMKM